MKEQQVVVLEGHEAPTVSLVDEVRAALQAAALSVVAVGLEQRPPPSDVDPAQVIAALSVLVRVVAAHRLDEDGLDRVVLDLATKEKS